MPAEPGAGRRTLSTSYSGRDNAFNFMRLVFALAVIVGHARILGYGVAGNPLGLPIDLGGLSVAGFFTLSGFLITRSGRRTPFFRYWWHRILRIFPGYWVCLLVTAALVGPALWIRRHGTLDGYLGVADGPFGYFIHNWTTNVGQGVIGDTLAGAAIADFNGSLWTLKYELACYVLISVLALVGVLRRARIVVLLLAVAGMTVIGFDFVREPTIPGPLAPAGSTFSVPVAGVYLTLYVVVYTTAFLLGATAELFRERLPINDLLGWASLVAVLAAIYFRLPVLGPALLAYSYLLLWAAIRLPKVFHRVGRRNDYSYGVYIYAFLVQQSLAIAGVPRLGMAAYLGLTLVLTLGVAALSWHLVEKQSLKLKDWTPPFIHRTAGYSPDLPPAAHPASFGAQCDEKALRDPSGSTDA
jgi:peptidoglycan/LPS O-acetylase OafA/YrhL